MKKPYSLLAAAVLLASVPSDLFGQCGPPTTYPRPNAVTLVPADWLASGRVVPPTPTWPVANNFAPNAQGAVYPAGTTTCPGRTENCNICPSQFQAPIGLPSGANNKSTWLAYMCTGNQYSISLCGSPAWDSHIVITTNANAFVAEAADGCGDGHATITFTPPTSNTYRIHVLNGSCGLPPNNGSILTISCSQASCPPVGDDVCGSTPAAICNPNFPPATQCSATPVTGAQEFPTTLTDECTTMFGSTAGATTSITPSVSSSCNMPAINDVWFKVRSSPLGAIALDVDHISATNLSMALYTFTGTCPGPPTLTEVPGTCNNDRIPVTDLAPFISYANPGAPNTDYYVRISAEGIATTGGTFSLCAYWPVPPANDQPCGAIDLPMSNPGCVPGTYTTQEATPLSGVTLTGGTCGTPGRDVWFRITTPVAGTVTVNTIAGSLSSMTMAIYTGTACGGPLNQVFCSNPAGMPSQVTGVYGAGQVLWVRVWSKTASDGTFSICAFMTQPPANDNPCGATPFPVRNGCITSVISTDNATQTAVNLYGANTVPNPTPCGGTPFDDIWFTVQVPASGQLAFDMDDFQMNNAALALYRQTGGSCPSTLALTQVAGSCFAAGSTNPGAANMPRGTVTGLTPNETLYLRVWRDGGVRGTAYLCVQDPVPPPVTGFNCYMTLRMADTGGNGWNGSYVTVTNLTTSTSANYTLLSGSGFINIPVGHTDQISVQYTAIGGFQNEISYSIVNQYNSPFTMLLPTANPPTAGLSFFGQMDCSAQVIPIGDCAGAHRFCSNQSISYPNALNAGEVNDLSSTNRGCLVSNERSGAWFKLTPSNTGTLSFTITPGGSADYDFALWGPQYGGATCPPTAAPIRCSYAAGSGPTGLSASAADDSEGAGGDRWVRHLINVQVGEYYWFYVDNFSMNGVAFDLALGGSASVSCNINPVDLIDFNAYPVQQEVEVYWSTSAERASSHFVVERSRDGADFEAIGTVRAQTNSVARTDYKHMDRAPYSGMNYYRLRQVDTDGTESLSQAVAVMFQGSAAALYVYPNPATNTLSAAVGSTVEGTVKWRVLDASGRIASEGSTQAVAHNGILDIPVSDLDGGSYLLELTGEDGSGLGYARFVKN